MDFLDGFAVFALVLKVAALIVAVLGRAAAPQGFFVECQVLLGDFAIHVGAHIAVTDGQGALLPGILGRRGDGTGGLVIPQAQRLIRGDGLLVCHRAHHRGSSSGYRRGDERQPHNAHDRGTCQRCAPPRPSFHMHLGLIRSGVHKAMLKVHALLLPT